MNKLSNHFTREEFACKCGCGFDTVDTKLIEALEGLRVYFGKPITINSGCRCPEYNYKIGGSPNSQHLLGRAADISIKDTDPKTVQRRLEFIKWNGGMGSYETFTHVDSRNSKARWIG